MVGATYLILLSQRVEGRVHEEKKRDEESGEQRDSIKDDARWGEERWQEMVSAPYRGD